MAGRDPTADSGGCYRRVGSALIRRAARVAIVAVVVLAAVVGLQIAPLVVPVDKDAGVDVTDGTAAAAPGDGKWTFGTNDRTRSSPAVADGTVYLPSRDGNLYAVDAESGTEKWSYPAGSLESSPTVSDGTVYVGSGDDGVYAIDAETGAEEWSYPIGAYVRSSPTVVDGTVYVGSFDGNVYAIDAETGTEEWSFSTGSDIRLSSPNVVDGTVYIGSRDDNVYAIDAETGTEEWSFSTGSNVQSSPTVANGIVYFGSVDGNVYAVDAGTGEEEWSYSTGRRTQSSPIVVDNTVYIGSSSENLYALDAGTGEEEWSYSVGSIIKSSPTFADGTVYIAGQNNGNVYAVDAETGTEEWSSGIGGEIYSSPTVSGDTVYIAREDSSDSGALVALERGSTADIDGSRNLLGTLGHNDEFTADGSIGDETLSGTVTDSDNYPIENATVEAVNASTGSTEATVATNADGFYETTVESGYYDVTASKSGLSPETKSVTVSGDTTLNFTLSSDTSISDPDPPNGETVSEPPVQLSVLADSANQSVQSINVDFYRQTNGSVTPASDTQIGSRTVAPGERATVTWDPPPGTYEWYAIGTADSGARDTGGPYTLGIGEADIVDGSEQPPDGAVVSPGDDVELAVDVRVDNNATVSFYDYETGNPENDPLIGSQSVDSTTKTASTSWNSDDRDASEEWYVVLSDSTGTRDTAGAFAFGADGQVVARDAETGEVIDDRTVRFDTTYPGGSETFDRALGTLDLSEVNAEPDDRIRIDVRAKDYYETTVEVPDKRSDADIYLERGSNWSANPSSDDPENTASVKDDPDRYLSQFELKDRTGRYPPTNATLSLRTDVDDDGETDLVHSSTFGAANRIGAQVKQDRQYELVIENDDGDERRLGAWTAIGNELVTLEVRAFDFDIPEAGNSGYVSQGSVEDVGDDNETELLRWQFSDPGEATAELSVAIYEKDNRSNGLLNRTYTGLGNASYTERLTGNQTGKAWVIELDGTRNGETFTSRQIVGETDLAPGIPLDPFYKEVFAALVLFVLAGVFSGVRAEAGAIIVPMSAGVMFWMGWLPGAVTAGAILVALFVAILYRLRSTPQPGVR